MAWLSMDSYRSMWEWLKRHDLVGRVSYRTAAIDDPAVELFAEPRLLHSVDHEGLWLRVVDAERALKDRAYSNDGEVTIGLTDDSLTPWNNRTIKLEASTEGAHVSSSQSTDLTMSAKALASLYSGFRSARQLRAWGLVEGGDDAVDTADRLFASSHAPHCPDHF
jgi:predicted acetyltransferase